MNHRTLWIAWGILYALCAALSFFPSPEGTQYGALVLLALIFFIPGILLLYRAIRADDRKVCGRIRLLSACSLGATLLAIILNFLSYSASAAAGMAMYVLLIVVSVPMVCGQIWVVSLFLWACLLIASHRYLRQNRS